LESAYKAGLTTEMLAYMTINEVVIRITSYFETKRAENLEQWRMVRRLAFVQACSMGAKYKNEEELWKIEGDRKREVSKDKIEMWRKWLIDNGKMKGEA